MRINQTKFSTGVSKLVSMSIILVGLFVLGVPDAGAQQPTCNRTITADVVAFDQIIFYNRFGSFDPGGMMFALRRDVVPINSGGGIVAGNVQLRPDKRPRPIVLRVNEGDCLQVTFTNLLNPSRAAVENLQFANAPDRVPYFDKQPFFGQQELQPDGSTRKIEARPGGGFQVVEYPAGGGASHVIDDGEVHLSQNDTPATRTASIHANGLDLVDSIASDGSFVGNNASSLAAPNQTRTYKWYAAKQGQYLLFSTAATSGGEGDGGQIAHGLFGTVNVEPKNSVWHRSQVTKDVLDAATTAHTPLGQPIINYAAVDANSDPLLNILKGNEIIHTDINAVISGFTAADEGCVSGGARTDPPSGTCGQAFREFTVIFHDELETGAQAFPEVNNDISVFHSVRDGFGINYGSSGLAAPLIANRKGIGPAANAPEYAFEEPFLESWTNGDPALLVRNDPVTGMATEAAFADDPSNVHHSYINDPVRFRNVHAGPKETHVFHLHAHQWLQSPRDPNSTYLDSQTISPGASFTYEINYGGSGNRNFTPGDSIFHCHLYPHFAQGMWELWRSHDVFEDGTPVLGFPGRNLPDGEIAQGVPTPALVPIPDLPMALMPTQAFQGFPFYVPAVAGHRPPQPPLSLERDGGLGRHIVLDGTTVDGLAAIPAFQANDPVFQRVRARNNDPNLINFARHLETAQVQFIPLNGSTDERTAMDFHAGRFPGGVPFTTEYNWPAIGYPSFFPNGTSGPNVLFLVGGQPEVAGAPFAEPCPPTYQPDSALGGARTTPMRHYRAAWIQFDTEDNAVFGQKTLTINNAGWHHRQGRIAVLEQDALPTLNGLRPPEPLFFRANSGDCIDYRVTNLIPAALNLDDFEIYQPTDTIGQHIHLVKFDVTASDGAANGFNYEEGAFSPEEVQHRVEAIRRFNGCVGEQSGDPRDGTETCPVAVVNPTFGPGPLNLWVGAQTLIERWWADPLINRAGRDRTIRTVFTHDHFSPSGHQHRGLYAGLIIEPTDAQWKFIDGTPMGGPTPGSVLRADGGPTSFAANIVSPFETFREFNFEIGDFAIVYTPELIPVGPPNRVEEALPKAVGFVGGPPDANPFPEAISAADPGTQEVNYRNEPIPLRIAQNNGSGQFIQKTGAAGDLANVFSSNVHGDPFTPLLKAYEGDRVQIRLLQGAQEEQHVFNLHGAKWLFEPGTPFDATAVNNSGYTNAQHVGISEHFEFITMGTAQRNNAPGKGTDHLYSFTGTDNLWDGMWGIFRVFQQDQAGLARLPNNPAGAFKSPKSFCPQGAPVREFFVDAKLARDILPGQALVYNNRFQIKDPNAIIFVEESDLPALQAGTKQPEPLILRAAAGDCINLTLRNHLPEVLPENDSWNFVPPIINEFNFNQVKTSNRISLHPQLLSYSVFNDDGSNVGFNPDTTLGPGQSNTFIFYAGDQVLNSQGKPQVAPIEFGVTGLRDMGDVIKHSSHGAIGSLIVEPQGSSWTTVGNSKATAVVTKSDGSSFREFVVLYQDDLSLQTTFPFPDFDGRRAALNSGNAMMNIRGTDDSEDSGLKAFNYRTEPLWARGFGFPPETDLQMLNDQDYTNTLSSTATNAGCGGACGDPETPVFTATAGTPVRFRIVHVAGHPRQHGYTLFGHHWNFEPFTDNSKKLGANPLTFEVGSYNGIGPTRHLNILTTAGGLFKVPGDYLYRTQESFMFGGGLWGIFRVTP